MVPLGILQIDIKMMVEKNDHQKLDKSIKFKKMKFSFAILAVAASYDGSGDDVLTRDPIQELMRLKEFSIENFDEWFSFAPSKWNNRWKKHFVTNTERMEDSFDRCGHDADQPNLDDIDTYNRSDPFEGIKQVTTGYRKMAERYLSQCSNQRKAWLQVKRMHKWNLILQAKLGSTSLKAISCEHRHPTGFIPVCPAGKIIQVKSAAYGR